MRIVFCILCMAWQVGVAAQLPLVPDSLKKGANEVAIEDKTVFEIFSIDKSRLTRSYKALILNRQANRYNNVLLHYNDFRKIVSAEATLKRPSGQEIETYKLRDFDDYGMDGFSLITDNRAKYLSIEDQKYPYIIEVSYTIDYSGSLFYPSWQPQLEKEGVLQSTFEVRSDLEDAFRHKSVGVQPQALSPSHLRWEVRSLVPFEREPYTYEMAAYAPLVVTAPNRFQMDGVEGDLSTWDGLGRWIQQLNREQDDLTSDQIRDLLAQVPEDATDLEKVKAAYRYLQGSTRYVSIQLGLGGWKPFPSSFVHEKKYGDCKALSHYTMSLLKHLGVKSHYTLIQAGAYGGGLDPDFPMSNFNHAILTVPMDQDTIWLECTSQTNPFGYLGTFTSGRKALMITDEGAEVIDTRSYDALSNRQITQSSITLRPDGSGTIEARREYMGLEVDNDGFSWIVDDSPADQKKWFIDKHNWGNLRLTELTLDAPSYDVVPKGQMEVAVEVQNMATKSADRLFFKPFIVTNSSQLKFKSEKRTVPLEIRYGYTQEDSVKVSFPAGYLPENNFAAIDLQTEFGSYQVDFHRGEDGYVFTRKMVLRAGKYPPEAYGAFKDFIKTINRGDRKRLVMVNKT